MVVRCNETLWGASFCGFGVCGQDGRCACNPGWEPDRTFFKSDACWLPSTAVSVAEGIVGFGSLIVAFIGIGFAFRLKKEARLFAGLSTASMIFTSCYMLAHHLEGNTHGAASVVFMCLAIGNLANAYAVVLYSLLKTIWQFAGGNVNRLKRTVTGVQVAEMIAFASCAIAMLVGLGMNDDHVFTMALATWVVIMSLHFMVLLYCIFVPTTEVVNCVKTNSDSADNPTARKTKHLVKKLKQFIFFSKVLGPAIVLICLVCAIICFVTGSVPFVWVLYFGIILQIPLLGAAQLKFAQPNFLGTATDKVASSTMGSNQLAAKAEGSTILSSVKQPE